METEYLPSVGDEELPNLLQVDVESRLGGGSMGRVFEASFKSNRVALKVLHPQKARREASIADFMKEAELMHRMQHWCEQRLCPRYDGIQSRRVPPCCHHHSPLFDVTIHHPTPVDRITPMVHMQ